MSSMESQITCVSIFAQLFVQAGDLRRHRGHHDVIVLEE